jgi:transcriptional regulator with XRE-family HTH domain
MTRPPLPVDTSTYRGRFGAGLRRRRETAKLRAEDCAVACGVTAATWWDWEHGRRAPAIDRLPDIAAALGCTTKVLIPT